jgi:hypothetical protein
MVHPLVFSIETYLVLCEVGTELINIIYKKFPSDAIKNPPSFFSLLVTEKTVHFRKLLPFSLPNALPRQNPEGRTGTVFE